MTKTVSVRTMEKIQNPNVNVGEGSAFLTRTCTKRKRKVLHKEKGRQTTQWCMQATYRDLGDVEDIQETSEVVTDLLEAVLVGIMGVGLDGRSRRRRRSKKR